MWDDPSGRSTTRWASATGTRRPSATTTSGGCRRPTTRSAAPTRSTATSATGPCSARPRPGRRSARTSRAATRRRSRCASRCSRRAHPPFANRCLLAGRAHLRPRGHAPAGNLLDGRSRSASIPRPSGATTSSSGRPSCTWRSRPAACRPGLPHTDPAFYLQKAAHWANAYIAGPGDAADTLNLYDVSGLAHYDLYRAITPAGNPPGLEVTQAQLLADLKKATRRRHRAGRRPTRSGSASPGRSGTPPRTAPGCR